MHGAEYTVRLDAFEGPLDLLLFLIRRAEVEVTDIPIATITSQYLEFLSRAADVGGGAGGVGGGIDIEEAGEFLVMAATLMEIKSRMLMPVVQGVDENGELIESGSAPSGGARDKPLVDPRADLVRQLLEYKRFRDAGDQLEAFRRDWHGRFPAGRALTGEAPAEENAGGAGDETEPQARVDLGDLTLVDLVEAFSRIIDTVDFSRVGEHRVLMDDTPIEIHAEELVVRLRERLGASTPADGLEAGEMDFREVFSGRSRGEAIGLFLAVLELVKQQRLGVRQEEAGGGGVGAGANVGGRVAIRLIEATIEQRASQAIAEPSV